MTLFSLDCTQVGGRSGMCGPCRASAFGHEPSPPSSPASGLARLRRRRRASRPAGTSIAVSYCIYLILFVVGGRGNQRKPHLERRLVSPGARHRRSPAAQLISAVGEVS